MSTTVSWTSTLVKTPCTSPGVLGAACCLWTCVGWWMDRSVGWSSASPSSCWVSAFSWLHSLLASANVRRYLTRIKKLSTAHLNATVVEVLKAQCLMLEREGCVAGHAVVGLSFVLFGWLVLLLVGWLVGPLVSWLVGWSLVCSCVVVGCVRWLHSMN